MTSASLQMMVLFILDSVQQFQSNKWVTASHETPNLSPDPYPNTSSLQRHYSLDYRMVLNIVLITGKQKRAIRKE